MKFSQNYTDRQKKENALEEKDLEEKIRNAIIT